MEATITTRQGGSQPLVQSSLGTEEKKNGQFGLVRPIAHCAIWSKSIKIDFLGTQTLIPAPQRVVPCNSFQGVVSAWPEKGPFLEP